MTGDLQDFSERSELVPQQNASFETNGLSSTPICVSASQIANTT